MIKHSKFESQDFCLINSIQSHSLLELRLKSWYVSKIPGPLISINLTCLTIKLYYSKDGVDKIRGGRGRRDNMPQKAINLYTLKKYTLKKIWKIMVNKHQSESVDGEKSLKCRKGRGRPILWGKF